MSRSPTPADPPSREPRQRFEGGADTRGGIQSAQRRVAPGESNGEPAPPGEKAEPPSAPPVALLVEPAHPPAATPPASVGVQGVAEHADVLRTTPVMAVLKASPATKTPTSVEAILAAELAVPPVDEPASGPRPTQTPILASQALMEDIAPMEPGRGEARMWCAAFGFLFVVLGILPLVNVLPGNGDAAVPWLLVGLIALVASLIRVAYRQRALAMVVLGALSGFVAVEANGAALARADGGLEWGMVRYFAAATLAAALLFRARYRAYSGARIALGIALAVAVPFVVHESLVLSAAGGFGASQVATLFALLTIPLSFAGFMGSESTGVGVRWAPLVVVAFAVDIGIRTALAQQGFAHGLAAAVGALGFCAAATLAAQGLFQVLAWRFAADARRIDLHAARDDEEKHSEPQHPSDWFPH